MRRSGLSFFFPPPCWIANLFHEFAIAQSFAESETEKCHAKSVTVITISNRS